MSRDGSLRAALAAVAVAIGFLASGCGDDESSTSEDSGSSSSTTTTEGAGSSY